MKATKATNYILFAAAALALSACSHDELPSGDPDGAVELRLTSGIEVQTRATHNLDTQLKTGETVRVWVDDAKNEQTSVTKENLYEDLRLTAGEGGALNGETMYFPQTGNAVDIYAIHGRFAEASPQAEEGFWGQSVTHEVAQDQKSGGDTDGYAQSDLVYARSTDVARTKKAVSLTFKHLLSKIEVVLVKGDGELDIQKVEILNTKLGATFTPDKEGDFTVTASELETASGSENAIEIDADLTDKATAANPKSDAGKALNEAVIVPQTLAQGTPFIRITTSAGGELVYSLPDGKEFAPATKYRYTITARLTGLTVKSEVGDWTDGGNTDGDAEMVIPAQVGDFYYSDGTYSTGFVEGKTAIGIVFAVGQSEHDESDYSQTGIKKKQCHGYVVALKDATSSYCLWGPSGTELGCYPKKDGVAQDNYNRPDIDWSGYAYTQKIIEKVGSADNLKSDDASGYPATYYAVVGYAQTVSAPEASSGWFLPSIGQLKKIYDLRESLPFSDAKGSALKSDDYWSSSESYDTPSDYSLGMRVGYGYVRVCYKGVLRCSVRAVLAF